MAEVITSQVKNFNRGGWVASGPAAGKIEQKITLGGVADAANEAVEVFSFDTAHMVEWVSLEIITPTSGAITVSVGFGGGSGGATQFLGEVAADAAAGTIYSGGESKANVIMPASDSMEIEVSGSAGAAGEVRILAKVADVGPIDGDA